MKDLQCLRKGNYIPWESQFRRFLDNNLEDGERMWNSIQNGPYQRPMVVDPINPTVPILEPLSKMTKGNKNLMHGYEITTHVRHSRLMDEFDKFAAKEGESSTSHNGSSSKDAPSESPGPKMPTESQLLTMIDTLGDTIVGFQTRINKTFLQDTEQRWFSNSQNELREFYKTNVIPMSRSLYKTLSEIKEELIEDVQEILNIFVSMEQKVNDKSNKNYFGK
ncbi:hypothetical protein Tco_1426305 [Tanacetum coccineum]